MATTITRADIRDAIRSATKEAFEHGEGWVYARLHPDGHISTGREVSQAIPESEYFRRAPHPVTFWSKTAKPGDRYTQWLEGSEDMTPEEIDDAIDANLSEADFEEETDEAARAIEEAGYPVI